MRYLFISRKAIKTLNLLSTFAPLREIEIDAALKFYEIARKVKVHYLTRL